ncbi:MAG: AraC family transcriptional regulator [Bacteroidales bacterium]|nr:AraC family transcriptional regulator [Bacteroidales bacterium]MCF8454898.1 AraC family transcriptional regulator [Bacteroidales bacterium]
MNVKPSTYKDYQERINKVLLYINEHLDEKLDLEQLASVSNFSIFHFHRIMRAHIHEPLASYISRLRLENAARLLKFSDDSITDIAFQIGYESAASFTKAFKKRFSIAPTEYRGSEIIKGEYLSEEEFESNFSIQPKIKSIAHIKVIFIRSMDDYNSESTGLAWKDLFLFAKEKKLFGWKTEMIGIGHDDPNITETNLCRYDACITISKEVKPEGRVGVQAIEGGKYAVFKYKGPYQRLGAVYNTIFGKWYPESGLELRDFPVFEKYINNPEKTNPEKLLTEIWVPVK